MQCNAKYNTMQNTNAKRESMAKLWMKLHSLILRALLSKRVRSESLTNSGEWKQWRSMTARGFVFGPITTVITSFDRAFQDLSLDTQLKGALFFIQVWLPLEIIVF